MEGTRNAFDFPFPLYCLFFSFVAFGWPWHQDIRSPSGREYVCVCLPHKQKEMCAGQDPDLRFALFLPLFPGSVEDHSCKKARDIRSFLSTLLLLTRCSTSRRCPSRPRRRRRLRCRSRRLPLSSSPLPLPPPRPPPSRRRRRRRRSRAPAGDNIARRNVKKKLCKSRGIVALFRPYLVLHIQ